MGDRVSITASMPCKIGLYPGNPRSDQLVGGAVDFAEAAEGGAAEALV